MTHTEFYADALDQIQNRLLRAVYFWMTVGLFISGITAYVTVHSHPLIEMIFGNYYMIWVLILVELGLVVAISSTIEKISVGTARVLFLLFSFVDGLTLATIFLAFTAASIAITFFIAGLTFGIMSIYGYFTDSDLSSWRKYLFMALIGIIVAFVVNFFLKSPTVDWIVSFIGVIVFVGLAAYDTQKIKQMGEQMALEEGGQTSRMAIVGALSLYLDFINLFLMLLQFLGNRRN